MMYFNAHVHSSLPLKDALVSVSYPFPSSLPTEGLYSVGWHPWHAVEGWRCHWTELENLWRLPQVRAIGEAGLDALSSVPMPLQEALFLAQAIAAERLHKPLVVHLVKATDALWRIHRELKPKQPWVLHGFRGKPQLLEQWLRLPNVVFSFGVHHSLSTLRRCPLSRMLLETDEDGLSISTLYDGVADALEMPVEQLCEQMEGNARRLHLLP